MCSLLFVLASCGKKGMPEPVLLHKTDVLLSTHYQGKNLVFTWYTKQALYKTEKAPYISNFFIYTYSIKTTCHTCLLNLQPQFTLTLQPSLRLLSKNKVVDPKQWHAEIQDKRVFLYINPDLFKKQDKEIIIETRFRVSTGIIKKTNITLFKKNPHIPAPKVSAMVSHSRDSYCLQAMNTIRTDQYHVCPVKKYIILSWKAFNKENEVQLADKEKTGLKKSDYYVTIYKLDSKTNKETLLKRVPASAIHFKLDYTKQPLQIRLSDRFYNESTATPIIIHKQ